MKIAEQVERWMEEQFPGVDFRVAVHGNFIHVHETFAGNVNEGSRHWVWKQTALGWRLWQ